MRLRLDLAYDGTLFHGWATQPGLRAVQSEVEGAIATVLRLDQAPRLTCAGRTDTGVHARGQVAHVDLDAIADAQAAATLARRLQRILPGDVALRGCRPAADGFDARFSALERRYVYRLTDDPAGPDPLARAYVVGLRRPLDVEAMTAAGTALLGEHDFASFCKRREGATTIRTLLELSSTRTAGVIETTVRADAFCHSMVRALMGAIVAVGEGRFPPAWAADVLAGGSRDSRVVVMPAHGLTLEEVVYPPDDQLAARAEASRQVRELPRRDDAGSPDA